MNQISIREAIRKCVCPKQGVKDTSHVCFLCVEHWNNHQSSNMGPCVHHWITVSPKPLERLKPLCADVDYQEVSGSKCSIWAIDSKSFYCPFISRLFFWCYFITKTSVLSLRLLQRSYTSLMFCKNRVQSMKVSVNPAGFWVKLYSLIIYTHIKLLINDLQRTCSPTQMLYKDYTVIHYLFRYQHTVMDASQGSINS